MTTPRTSGTGRRFELVLIRLRPPTPRTVGLIAKHAAPESYHWVLVIGRVHARPENLARLLAVAYLDEASGLLGRGDPRWAVPRAYLRSGGELEARDPGDPDRGTMPPFVRDELQRIASWLRLRHGEYLADLRRALRSGAPDDRFRRIEPREAEERGFLDPTGRGLLAPDPPPVVTRTRSRPPLDDPASRLPWRRFHSDRG